MAIDLSEVTICSVDCVTPSLAAEAINKSSEELLFGDSILFSDTLLSGQFKSIAIPKITSRMEYSKFILEELPFHINTEYVLIVQWDGFVTNPYAWDKNFLKYDYIGACWPWHNDGFTVGNGGFSLRSRRLMETFLEARVTIDYKLNEDELLCRSFRPLLEQNGMKFASPEIACKFSYERGAPQFDTFGFHGLFNIWRHLDDSKVINLAHQFTHKNYQSIEYLELLMTYFQHKKFSIFRKMHSLLIKNLDGESIENHLLNLLGDIEQAKAILSNWSFVTDSQKLSLLKA